MKKRLFIILTFLILANFDSKAQEVKENKIITSGEATIWIEPDRARIFFGIETLERTIGRAREENAAKVRKVMEALKRLNIEGMIIEAPSYNVSLVKEPEYEATRERRLPKIIGYKVRQDFTVLLKNEDLLILSKDAGEVIDTALTNGVNVMQGIYFSKEDPSKNKRSVIELAVRDAISNAKTIADAADVLIKDYILIDSSIAITEHPRVVQPHRALFIREEGVGVPTTLVAGKIAITCKVRLQCSIK